MTEKEQVSETLSFTPVDPDNRIRSGLRWVRRGGCIGSWWGNRREGENWGDLRLDRWIILGWISRRWDACECGNEPSGSVKCGEFLD